MMFPHFLLSCSSHRRSVSSSCFCAYVCVLFYYLSISSSGLLRLFFVVKRHSSMSSCHSSSSFCSCASSSRFSASYSSSSSSAFSVFVLFLIRHHGSL